MANIASKIPQLWTPYWVSLLAQIISVEFQVKSFRWVPRDINGFPLKSPLFPKYFKFCSKFVWNWLYFGSQISTFKSQRNMCPGRVIWLVLWMSIKLNGRNPLKQKVVALTLLFTIVIQGIEFWKILQSNLLLVNVFKKVH